MRVFITAVAGTGMGSLAGLLKELGHDVAGSDVAFHPPMGPALRSWGVTLLEGFSREHLLGMAHGGKPPEVVVVGNVCNKDNPEAIAAEELGIPRIHLADALQRFALPHTSPLVVSGTHGKTTTTGLCAHLLQATGKDPGYLIGGIPESVGRSFHPAGRRKLVGSAGQLSQRATPFVIEGDEYDTAFWEKTAKFLHYRAETAILTSIEHDHIDIYPTAQSYEAAFERFVAQLPKNGLLVAFAGDPKVAALAKGAPCEVAFYGLQDDAAAGLPLHYMAAPVLHNDRGTSFDFYVGGVLAGRYLCPLLGDHNLRNCLAALAVCAQGYGVPLAELKQPLAAFRGIKRRQQLLGRPGGVAVYDDFAHHPTAVRETLRGLRQAHPAGRLIVIFEPRSATACRNMHQTEYAAAFDAATDVLLAPVGRKNLPADEQLDVLLLARTIASAPRKTSHHAPTPQAPRAVAKSSVDELIDEAMQLARPGDTIAILSNGAFDGIHGKLVEALSASPTLTGEST